jgi:hypothetical protein
VLEVNPFVRLRVVPYGAKEAAEAKLRDLLALGGGFEKDIGSADGEGVLARVYAGGESADVVENCLAAEKEKIRRAASGQTAPFAWRDQRFPAHLRRLAPEALDRLDLWFPEDSLAVEYSTPGDRRGFHPIQEGSPGQKTAALLAFFLSYGDEPLVLDQPEDDLDSALIYDLIVKHLREIKTRRQLIVVTHNPNIVVNGDAELVTAFVARGGETQQERSGSLQDLEVRKTVCDVMEGGREAFEQRWRRITLEKRRV